MLYLLPIKIFTSFILSLDSDVLFISRTTTCTGINCHEGTYSGVGLYGSSDCCDCDWHCDTCYTEIPLDVDRPVIKSCGSCGMHCMCPIFFCHGCDICFFKCKDTFVVGDEDRIAAGQDLRDRTALDFEMHGGSPVGQEARMRQADPPLPPPPKCSFRAATTVPCTSSGRSF